MSAVARFKAQETNLGYMFDGEITIGGNDVPLIRDGDHIYVSGQIPRVGDTVVVTGAAGAETTLEQARQAAKICVMRALARWQRSLGSLDHIKLVPRITVYVQSAAGFTQQSEVADDASAVLFAVLGQARAYANLGWRDSIAEKCDG